MCAVGAHEIHATYICTTPRIRSLLGCARDGVSHMCAQMFRNTYVYNMYVPRRCVQQVVLAYNVAWLKMICGVTARGEVYSLWMCNYEWISY